MENRNVYEVPSIQVQPTAGFYSSGYTLNGLVILSPIIPLSYLDLKHDWSAECCSTKSHYELRGRNKELLLQGNSESCSCCQCGRPPIYIQSLNGTTMIHVQIGRSDCCSSKNEVEIYAPPGNPIGYIDIKQNFFTANNYTISSTLNSQKLSVQKKSHFFTEEYYFKNETGEPVAMIKCESSKFRLEVESEIADPIMKANLIGFMLMLDVFRQERRAAAAAGG